MSAPETCDDRGVAGTNGKQKTARDMILSLGVIVLVAGVIYLFIPHDDSAPDLKRVDYRVELLTARRAASYPVAAPQGLPDTWKATSVRFQGDEFDAWHLGFHDPEGEYVAVEQSTQRRPVFVDEATQGARETGKTEKIDGRTWTRYEGGRYDALVLEGTKGSTTVVTGTASFAQLTKMADALKTE
ncbi:secreted protein [Streptomyces azureus]|uniref:Secreted protein n=1 Tax=Streptomyces azureus TaxID=146537 RepID=A0A0K8PL24_STRAJ|nr:secreted protein [Streptomyces azureus]